MGARTHVAVLAVALGAMAACGADPGDRTAPVTLVATTTIEDSGLLDTLVAAFRAEHPGHRVRVLTAGTGQALALGRAGDAGVLITHDPAAESAFVAAGYGVARWPLMHNEFIIAGPADDPAGVRGFDDAVAAFRRIRRAEAPFVSRGDDSGTHRKERALWAAVDSTTADARSDAARTGPGVGGARPDAAGGRAGGWYIEAGVGMGEALRLAAQRRAYILTDRATLANYRSRLELEVLVAGDPRLHNPYGLTLTSHAAESPGARAVAEWLRSADGRALIGGYGVDRFDRPLFVPDPS